MFIIFWRKKKNDIKKEDWCPIVSRWLFVLFYFYMSFGYLNSSQNHVKLHKNHYFMQIKLTLFIDFFFKKQGKGYPGHWRDLAAVRPFDRLIMIFRGVVAFACHTVSMAERYMHHARMKVWADVSSRCMPVTSFSFSIGLPSCRVPWWEAVDSFWNPALKSILEDLASAMVVWAKEGHPKQCGQSAARPSSTVKT